MSESTYFLLAGIGGGVVLLLLCVLFELVQRRPPKPEPLAPALDRGIRPGEDTPTAGMLEQIEAAVAQELGKPTGSAQRPAAPASTGPGRRG